MMWAKILLAVSLFALSLVSLQPASAQNRQCSSLFARNLLQLKPQLKIVKPALYAISKNGHTSFLFGTFPMKMDVQTLPKFVDGALRRSARFVTDVDTQANASFDAMMSPTGAKLSSSVSKEAWLKSQPMLDGVPEEIRPVYVYGQYVESLLAASREPALAGEMMETQLLASARRNSKRVMSLQHPDEVLRSYAETVTPELLDWTLTKMSPADIGTYDALQREAYVEGNLQKYQRVTESADTAMHKEPLTEALVKVRNRNWVNQLNQLHREDTFFFSVDVGHLVGPDGLIELLADEGFWITRVSDQATLDRAIDGAGRWILDNHQVAQGSDAQRPTQKYGQSPVQNHNPDQQKKRHRRRR